jgi:CheY-like chemotaxis protein
MTRILVIDDDDAVRSAVKLILETNNYEVVAACDGREGIKTASQDIDLVICDLFMPQMDGIETIRILRETKPQLPLIAMSGSMSRNKDPAAPDYLSMAGKFGAVFKLQKPFRPNELLDMVRRATAEGKTE